MAASSRHEHRVLIVEDEDDSRAMYAFVLRSMGWHVVEAADAEAGLAALRANDVCVVLLDLYLPGMDGIGFSDQQHADARFADVPIVLVTGARDIEAAGQRIGAAELLRKPCHPDTIARAVEAACVHQQPDDGGAGLGDGPAPSRPAPDAPVMLQVGLPALLHRRLEEEALIRDRSVSELVAEAVTALLARREPPKR
jgi:two-component system chemotaxis response regulator CheY